VSLLSWPAMSVPGPTVTASRVLRDMLVLLALTGALWAFHHWGRTLPTAAVAAVWAALALAIAAGLFARARLRRRVFLTAYLRDGSTLARRLRGGWLLGLRSIVPGAALALVLTVALLRIELAAVWITMIAGALILPPLRALLTRALSHHANPRYLPELIWRIAIPLLGLVMTAVLIAVAFHRPYPDVGSASLESAVWHLVDRETARSDPTLILLEVSAAKDALRLWLAQQLMPEPGESWVQALGWLIVLAEEVLFVWSYLALLSAALIAVDSRDGAWVRAESAIASGQSMG
jgi:hypothetical protein